jgi:Spy/CpxP family protein refolding chaperone
MGALMRKLLLASVAIAVTSSAWSLCALAAPGDAPSPPTAAEMQNVQEMHAAMLEAHLAGMKAGLKLTAEQEKNWPAFEAAIREAAKAREEGWRQMREQMSGAERPSPIERMRMMSERLGKISTELTALADAGKPLYDGLTDSQKRVFGPLLREFVQRGAHPGIHMRHGGPEGEGGPGRME